MTRQKHLDLTILIVSFALVGLYEASGGGGFPLDDSWIHQGYARNLAEHGEWSLAPGAPSAATTSPLFVVLLAIGYKLGVAYPLWSFALGAAALALLGMLMARMSVRFCSWNAGWSWLPPALTLGTWHLLWSAVAGMETIVFCLLTTALVYWAWRIFLGRSSALSSGHAITLGLLSGLVTLTRPEGMLLSALVLVSVIASEASPVSVNRVAHATSTLTILRERGRPFRCRRAAPLKAKPFATGIKSQADLGGATAVKLRKTTFARLVVYSSIALLTFAVIVFPYVYFNWTLTGSLLPSSVTAKLQQQQLLLGAPILSRILSIMVPVCAGAQFLVLPGLAVYTWLAARGRCRLPTLIAILPLVWVAALVLLYAARLPAAYQHGRYMIPILPPIVLCGGIGLAYAMNNLRSRRFSRILSRTWLGATLSCGAVFTLAVGPVVFRDDVAIVNEEMVRTAKWISANVAQDDLVAGHDIGAFGYFARRGILDLAGLLSPEIIPILRDTEAVWALLESRDVQVLFAFPDQIPGGTGADKRLCRVFSTGGRAALDAGGQNMAVYRLDWRGDCPQAG
ncbi:MAG: hypothetical protein OXG60_18345 [Chloroflexi bacterium]|nr:hypothetical protein [Chloroflexota bacterium]